MKVLTLLVLTSIQVDGKYPKKNPRRFRPGALRFTLYVSTLSFDIATRILPEIIPATNRTEMIGFPFVIETVCGFLLVYFHAANEIFDFFHEYHPFLPKNLSLNIILIVVPDLYQHLIDGESESKNHPCEQGCGRCEDIERFFEDNLRVYSLK